VYYEKNRQSTVFYMAFQKHENDIYIKEKGGQEILASSSLLISF
jgi:hypothetical protein